MQPATAPLSIDSLAQAALFATHGHGASAASSAPAVALLAGTFGLGMMAADAGNGLLLAWFARRSDGLARQASRFSSAFIAIVAVATAAAVVLRETRSGFAQAWEQAGVWAGVGLVLLTSLVYALWLVQQRTRSVAALR